MIKKMMLFLLMSSSFASHAGAIQFCVNNKDFSWPQFTVDSRLYYHNAAPASDCWNHTLVGNKVVIFTNGFNINYNGTFCGKMDPCIISVKNNNNILSQISASVFMENNKPTGTLFAYYQ